MLRMDTNVKDGYECHDDEFDTGWNVEKDGLRKIEFYWMQIFEILIVQ